MPDYDEIVSFTDEIMNCHDLLVNDETDIPTAFVNENLDRLTAYLAEARTAGDEAMVLTLQRLLELES